MQRRLLPILVFKNERGLSMVEMAITAGLIGLGSFALSSVILNSNGEVKKMSREARLLSLRSEILATIGNEKAWEKTKAANPVNMKCLNEGKCENGSNGQFDLYDFTGQLVHKATDSGVGFTANVEDCGQPTVVNTETGGGPGKEKGSDKNGGASNNGTQEGRNDPPKTVVNCPIKVKLKWSTKCDATKFEACKHPDEYVDVLFEFDDVLKKELKSERFNVVKLLRRNLSFSAPAVRCASDKKLYIGSKAQSAIFWVAPKTTAGGCAEVASLRGLPGERGPVGERGPDGPTGQPGPMGPQGSTCVIDIMWGPPADHDGNCVSPPLPPVVARPPPPPYVDPCTGKAGGELYMCMNKSVGTAFEDDANVEAAKDLLVRAKVLKPGEEPSIDQLAAIHFVRFGVYEGRQVPASVLAVSDALYSPYDPATGSQYGIVLPEGSGNSVTGSSQYGLPARVITGANPTQVLAGK